MFLWASGDAFNTSLWLPVGEPNNDGGNEGCTQLRTYNSLVGIIDRKCTWSIGNGFDVVCSVVDCSYCLEQQTVTSQPTEIAEQTTEITQQTTEMAQQTTEITQQTTEPPPETTMLVNGRCHCLYPIDELNLSMDGALTRCKAIYGTSAQLPEADSVSDLETILSLQFTSSDPWVCCLLIIF